MLRSEDEEEKHELEDEKEDKRTIYEVSTEEINEGTQQEIYNWITWTVAKFCTTHPVMQNFARTAVFRIAGMRTSSHWLTGLDEFNRIGFDNLVSATNKTLETVGLQKMFITFIFCVPKVIKHVVEKQKIKGLKGDKLVTRTKTVERTMEQPVRFECPFCSVRYRKDGHVSKYSDAMFHEVEKYQETAQGHGAQNRQNFIGDISCLRLDSAADEVLFLQRPAEAPILAHYKRLLTELKEEFTNKPFIIIPTFADYPTAVVFDIPHVRSTRLELYKEVLPHVKDKNLAALVASHV